VTADLAFNSDRPIACKNLAYRRLTSQKISGEAPHPPFGVGLRETLHLNKVQVSTPAASLAPALRARRSAGERRWVDPAEAGGDRRSLNFLYVLSLIHGRVRANSCHETLYPPPPPKVVLRTRLSRQPAHGHPCTTSTSQPSRQKHNQRHKPQTYLDAVPEITCRHSSHRS
jgi:hypothetical protein